MTSTERRIGFIGIGTMGFPMSSRLCQAGFSVTAFDTDPRRVEKLVGENPGVRPADSLTALAGHATVITMLPNSAIVESVVLGQPDRPGLVDILPANATLIDMSSSDPVRSRLLAETLAKRGLRYLDAPVSGGVARARNGTLAIMVGGEKAEFERQSELFAHFGSTITRVGSAGAGHALKALNNYISAAGLVATVEALLVGQAFGLDPAVMTDVINRSSGKNNTTELKVKQFMLSGTFDFGFALQLMTKDVATAVNLGEALGWDLHLGKEVSRLWSAAAGELSPAADHTEMYQFLRSLERPKQKSE